MVVRTIEMLLEYASIMLCIHKVAREKIILNSWMILIFLLEWGLFYVDMPMVTHIRQCVINVCIFLYINKMLAPNFRQALKIYGIMICLIVLLQLSGLFVVVRFCGKKEYYGIIINAAICLGIFYWKESFAIKFICLVKKIRPIYVLIVVYVINLLRIFYLCYVNGFINANESILFLAETLILSTLIFIWTCQEKDNQEKIKMLQLYELYSETFEEVIKTIRSRQHEYKNQINAIKCMKYTIIDERELLKEQEKYCEYLLENSEISNLLNIKGDPVLIGFLYANILKLERRQIAVEYNVNIVNISDKILCYELIELIGILLDNAVEAIEQTKAGKIKLKLVEIEKDIVLEIANTSRVYLNSELEKFCKYGFSTKGKDRGTGLARVNEIVKKKKATLLIHNKSYENENYLSFVINFCDK